MSSNNNSNNRNKNNIVDLTSDDDSNSKKHSSSSSGKKWTDPQKRMSVRDMKDELRRLGVPFSDCFTRKDIESRLVLAREAFSNDEGDSSRSRDTKPRGNSFSSLSGGGNISSNNS